MSSQSNIPPLADRFMRIAEVVDTVGLSRSEVYRLIGRDAFPKPIKISVGRNAPALWLSHEVRSWMQARVDDWRGRGEPDAA
jgi:prophage regulatory protein